MKKTLALIITILSIVFSVDFIVNANSAPLYITGSDSNGIIILDAENTIEVLNEDLTLNLFADDIEYNSIDCKSNLSAKYTFHNKSQDTNLKAKLVFPIGTLPSYVNEVNDNTFTIKVNDEIIPHNTRYSLSTYYNILEEVKHIEDDYITVSDLSPTANIYLNTIKIENYNNLIDQIVINLQNSKNIKLVGKDEHLYNSYFDNTAYGYPKSSEFSFYTIGQSFDDLKDRISFKGWNEGVEHKYDNIVDLNYQFNVSTSLTDKTLLDIIKENKTNDNNFKYNINDIDLYNITLLNSTLIFNYNDEGDLVFQDNAGALAIEPLYYMNIKVWAEYEIDIKADETITNEVICPIYPEYDYGYETPVYRYKYYLSPATVWADFNKLNLIINTDIYIYSCSIGDLTKTETGYTLTTHHLPSNELTLSYGESETFPNRARNLYNYIYYGSCGVLFGIPFLILLSMFLVRIKNILSIKPGLKARKISLWLSILISYLLFLFSLMGVITSSVEIVHPIFVFSILLLSLGIYEFFKLGKYNYIRLILIIFIVLQYINVIRGNIELYYVELITFSLILFCVLIYTLNSQRLENKFIVEKLEEKKNYKGYYGIGYTSNKQRILFLIYLGFIFIIFVVLIVVEARLSIDLKYILLTFIIYVLILLVSTIILSMYNLRFIRHFTKDYDIKSLENNIFKMLEDKKINPNYRTLIMVNYLICLIYYDVDKYEEIYKSLEVPSKANILQQYYLASLHILLSKEEFYIRVNNVLSKKPYYRNSISKILINADAMYFGRCNSDPLLTFKYETKNKASNAGNLMILVYYYYHNGDLENAKKYKDIYISLYKEFTSIYNKVNELDLDI